MNTHTVKVTQDIDDLFAEDMHNNPYYALTWEDRDFIIQNFYELQSVYSEKALDIFIQKLSEKRTMGKKWKLSVVDYDRWMKRVQNEINILNNFERVLIDELWFDKSDILYLQDEDKKNILNLPHFDMLWKSLRDNTSKNMLKNTFISTINACIALRRYWSDDINIESIYKSVFDENKLNHTQKSNRFWRIKSLIGSVKKTTSELLEYFDHLRLNEQPMVYKKATV